MDVILHLGAHRTGSVQFQHYLRSNRKMLAAQHIGLWMPERLSDGLLTGLTPGSFMPFAKAPQDRAQGRVRLALARRRAAGTRALVVSDADLAGTLGDNLRQAALYPAIGERIARLAHVFGGQIRKVVLSVRAPESYWASALAVMVARGRNVPAPKMLETLATAPRGWRDVITDLACAVPEATLLVRPHQTRDSDPARLLALAVPEAELPRAEPSRDNAAPDLGVLRRLLRRRGSRMADLPEADTGRWQPFDADQQALLRERFADDLFWLSQGADGLATLTEEKHPHDRGQKTRHAGHLRGQAHDKERRLDSAGRV